MRLNGVKAEVGTVIGYHKEAQRFLTVYSVDSDGCDLRFSTSEELTAIGTREPRSVTEHLGVPLRMTSYGPARMFGPRPRVKPKVVNKRKAKEIFRAAWNTGQGI